MPLLKATRPEAQDFLKMNIFIHSGIPGMDFF